MLLKTFKKLTLILAFVLISTSGAKATNECFEGTSRAILILI